MPVRVTVWNEFRHERRQPRVAAIYPEGIHAVLAGALRGAGLEARCATLDEPEHGLTEQVLDQTDVLTWWGHGAHQEVRDDVVERIQRRVVAGGMGVVVLHSGHMSKIFRRLLGTGCRLRWREDGDRVRLWVLEPGHPIAHGLPEHFEVEHDETYGERFDVPPPDELVLCSWYPGGEVFRSGRCYRRGRGRVFYFAPGHETYPVYHDAHVQRVICNAVRWAAPEAGARPTYGRVEPREPLRHAAD